MKGPAPTASRTSRTYGVVRVVLLAAILVYLGWQIYAGRSALAALHLQWDGVSLIGALLSGIAAYQCLVLGWLMLLRRSGHHRAGRLRQYQRIWWVSYLYRYVPGKVMLVVERARLGSAAGIPPVAGAAIAVVESLLAILAGSAVSLLAVSYYAAADGRLLAGVVIVATGTVFLFPAGFRLLCRARFIRSRFPELQSVAFGAADILATVVPYILHYLLLGLSFFLASRSLGLFTWSALAGLCGVYALSHVVSLIAVVAPGGLGVREGMLAVQLGRMVPNGVAGALAIAVRVWFTGIELFSYLTVVLLCPARFPDSSDEPEPSSEAERFR